MLVRKPANRSGSHIIGKFPSPKLGRTILYESTIERDLLYLLDYAFSVTYIAEQPLVITYIDNGKSHRYTPDFQVVEANRTYIVECKPEALVNDPDNQRIFSAAQTYCASQGWQFTVATDQRLRAGFRLRNVKMLRQFAAYAVAPQTKGSIYSLLQTASATPLTIAQIKTILPLPSAEVQTALFHMAYHHEIFLPLNAGPISDQTSVSIPNHSREEKIL